MEMNYKRSKVFYFLIFLMLCFCSQKIPAQQQPTKKVNKNKYEWGNMGLGIALPEMGSDVITRSYGVSYNKKVGLIYLQGAIYGGLNQDIPSLFGIHIAPGYAIGFHKPMMIALSIGPGYYAGDSEDRKAYRALGANATLQMLFKPVSDIGVGAELFFS